MPREFSSDDEYISGLDDYNAILEVHLDSNGLTGRYVISLVHI